MKKLFIAFLICALVLPLITIASFAETNTPYYTVDDTVNGVNITRSQDTIIIYKDKKTSGTNIWGYEVTVDAAGYIIAVGGNDSVIPEGGFIVSGHGTGKTFLEENARLGAYVTIDYDNKKLTIKYDADCHIHGVQTLIDDAKSTLAAATAAYKLIDNKTVTALISAAESTFASVKPYIESDFELFEEKKTEIEAKLNKAVLLCSESSAVETRGLWIRPEEKTKREVFDTVEKIAIAGINLLCIEVLYNSTMIIPMPEGSLLEQNPSLNGFDVLEAYVEACEKYDVELYAWMVVFRIGYDSSTYASKSLANKKPEWRIVSNTGINYVENMYGKGHYLNPALPEVRKYLLSVYEYILDNYAIDGFQLDYIRYPDLVDGVDYGYDEYTMNLFEDEYGIDPSTIEIGGANWNEWCAFRAKFVTDFVLDIKAMIDKKRPDVYFSADVSPDYENSSRKMKQDSTLWMSEGYLDMIFPMAYGENLVQQAIAKTIPFTGDHIYIYMGAGDFGLNILQNQIKQTREKNIEGLVFFDYSLYKNYLQNIAETLYKNKAITPSHNAKAAVIALLSEARARINDLILPAGGITQEQANELTDLITAFDAALETSTLSACSTLADSLYAKADTLETTDQAAKTTILSDTAFIKKIAYLSNDNARAEYIAKNPIIVTEPVDEESQMESTPESETEISDVSEIESTPGEKSDFPFATMGIIATVVIIAAAIVIVLTKRKKKDDTDTKA
ncbi:MAG: hypothetical protein A2Y17_03940 [Clostridiales bacterium GWF2_38_85]|nr:MAG: hypothetical protein A2Y17_03940 [Clostridiales bacterium GWF2_38_85]HBL83947.1 hypothetical protein [Clostridiales bacterium]